MSISLHKVLEIEKEILRNMMMIYRQELLGQENPEEYKYFELYFSNKDYRPYFIKHKKNIIGFALVNRYSVTEKGLFSIAEFYIEKKYRNRGLGRVAAYQVFDLFHGKWEIRELQSNKKAQIFWRNVIQEYTHGNFSEIHLDNKSWSGPVQVFEN